LPPLRHATASGGMLVFCDSRGGCQGLVGELQFFFFFFFFFFEIEKGDVS
jgi:hypothetical protein